MTGADYDTTSNSWLESPSMGRYCGSIFASSLIKTLPSSSSPLLVKPSNSSDTTPGGSPGISDSVEKLAMAPAGQLLPEEPNQEQVKSHNAFCHAILDSCKRIHRLWDDQTFTFSAQEDEWEHSWTGRTGIPLAYFEQRWNKLVDYPYTGGLRHADPDPANPLFVEGGTSRTGGGSGESPPDEMTASISRGRTLHMARIFLDNCPGDWTQGWNVALGGNLRDFINGDPMASSEEVIAATLLFRWHYCLATDELVCALGLPVPSGKICFQWNEGEWRRNHRDKIDDFKERTAAVHFALLDHEFLLDPGKDQSPPFYRPLFYMKAAIVEAQKTKAETLALVKQTGLYMKRIRHFAAQTLIKDYSIRYRGQEWLKTLGRRVRRSLSPRKSQSGSGEQLSSLTRSDSTGKRQSIELLFDLLHRR